MFLIIIINIRGMMLMISFILAFKTNNYIYASYIVSIYIVISFESQNKRNHKHPTTYNYNELM